MAPTVRSFYIKLKICRVELCTELFYAIVPTLCLCFLLICYPYILSHFWCFLFLYHYYWITWILVPFNNCIHSSHKLHLLSLKLLPSRIQLVVMYTHYRTLYTIVYEPSTHHCIITHWTNTVGGGGVITNKDTAKSLHLQYSFHEKPSSGKIGTVSKLLRQAATGSIA